MPDATLRLVAQLAGVAPVTVSRVVNDRENVASGTREKILAIIRDLDYRPNVHAANLRRRRLSGANSNGLKDRFVNADERIQQILRLRKHLDRLRKHAERIQTCVDMMQETYTRRLSSCPAS